MAYSYPALPSNPTRAHFQRLLWRAGFAGSHDQITHYVKLGLPKAVTELLTPFHRNVLVGPVPTDGGNRLQPLALWGHDCLWWLDRMVRSRNQLVERMTLNLHDLFATSNAGVGNTRHMLRQNRLLRAHAVGNFHDLLEQITVDPAMLLWLNGADSNKWEPNENYGREAMELFCLGNDRRRGQPAAGGLGRLVARRLAEERDQPGRGAVERRGRPVHDEQRVVDPQLMVDTLAGLSVRSAANEAMAAADDAVGGAVNVANRLSALTQPTLPPNGLGYGSTSFDQRMSNLAWMLDSNLGMRVACVSYDDGWDFHDSQVSRQAQNLSRMSTTLAAFQADLEARGLADRVITLVWSEFGRRVEDNDSGGGGTDHGAGGLALVIGTHAKGGLAAEFPGISDADLDQWGNLKVPTDYRQIYTNLLGGWMGTDPADVIPNASSYTPLDLVA